MARIELVQNAEWLLYDIQGVERVVKALSPVSATVQAGELFVTQDSIGWAAPDGSGGIEARAVAGNALESTSFSGASGTGTSELAAEASSEKLKFRAASGTNYKLQGDLRTAKKPTITSLSSATNGTKIQSAANVKQFLPQTVKIFVWRDENDIGWQQFDPPNDKWQEIFSGSGTSTYVDTGAQDGVQHVYCVQNQVTDIDGTSLFAESDKKTFTFDDSASVDPPGFAPNGPTLTPKGTDSTPYDLLGQWSDPTSTAQGWGVNTELQEKEGGPGGTGTWTTVRGGGRTSPGVPETTFGGWQNAKNNYYYRFRARYFNEGGEGPWSEYSTAIQFIDGLGEGG